MCRCISGDWRDFLDRLGPNARPLTDAIRAMRETGVRFVAGTDAGMPGSAFDDYAGMLQFFAATGFGAGEILDMATAHAADALGLGHVTGRLRAGMSADVLGVDGDPADGPSVLRSPPRLVPPAAVTCSASADRRAHPTRRLTGMRTWSSVDVPRLDGARPAAAPVRHRDRRGPADRPGPDRATMYVCGITPYDATHLGHAATYLAFDLVNRLWRDLGHDVHYVQNVTDIDDPLLERAARDQDDWVVLGMRETALFREDMEALRVLPPRHYIGAVEAIGGDRRAGRQAARVRAPPTASTTRSTRTSTTTSPPPGASATSPTTTSETMVPLSRERGGDPDRPGKRDPLDPLLWRMARAGRAVLGVRPRARAAPAGTSSAPRSR